VRGLAKPDHLQPATRRSPVAVVALVLGVAAFVVVMVAQRELWATPDWRISVPGFALTFIASLISLARREKAYALWITGLALAAAALVLGWFLMIAVVVAVAAILMLILHTVM
jgi:uncharacterized membrane protein YccC